MADTSKTSMKSLQFHVTIAVPDGFDPCPICNAGAVMQTLIARGLPQLFACASDIIAPPVPTGIEVTVTPEGR